MMSIFLMGTALTIFGLCFLMLAIPDNPKLHIYRVIRKVMAFAFFFFALAYNFYFKIQSGFSGHANLLGLMTLVMACIHMFLFTFALIVLVNNRFPDRNVLFKEILFITCYILFILVNYFVLPQSWESISFPLLCGGFVFMLLRYSRIFLKQYHGSQLCTANHPFDVQERNMQWTLHVFILMGVVSVLALLYPLFGSEFLSSVFSISLLAFYSYFSICFINYPVRMFHLIGLKEYEKTVKNPQRIVEVLCKEEHVDTLPVITPYVDNLLDDKVKKWIVECKFTEHGITLTQMCKQIGTNQKYLSLYINARAKNFRDWINALRMEEVKRLLISEPHRQTDEIAMQAGYSNIKYFRKLFRDYMGCNPEEYVLIGTISPGSFSNEDINNK